MKKQIIPLAAVLLFFTGCREENSTSHIPTAEPFAMQQYLGIWHEAARMPHRFEKDIDSVTAEYFRTEDGSIRVRNRGLRNGKERMIEGFVKQKKPGTGELEVSFFRPFYGDYRIIALKSDYSAALVTSATKDYAWILVRDPEQAKTILPEYVSLLKQWGFDTDKLIYPAMTAK